MINFFGTKTKGSAIFKKDVVVKNMLTRHGFQMIGAIVTHLVVENWYITNSKGLT